jgi:hypothetical protein
VTKQCPMCLVGGDVDITNCDYDREDFVCTIKCKSKRESNEQSYNPDSNICNSISISEQAGS